MMVTLDDLLARIHFIRLDLNTEFRGVTYREIALIQGPHGWGEFSPFLEYEAEEASRWLASGIEAAFTESYPLTSKKVRINATLPAVAVDAIPQVMSQYPGARSVKVKVTGDERSDLERIQKAEQIAPGIKIRIDVNGIWSVDEAISRINTLDEALEGGLEYVEQPCATLEEMRAVKKGVGVRLALDETLRKSADPLTLDLKGACDLLVLKVTPLGGIANSLAIARHHQLPVVVSSALESAVGISRGATLVAELGKLFGDQLFDAGLATGALFKEDVHHIEITDGEIEVKDLLVKEIDRFQLERERIEWWQNRVRDCYQVLA